MNYYALLGVRRDADQVAIRHAFRVLARRYHPDAGGGSSAEKFREIVEAYDTLSDPVRRRRYDDTLRVVQRRPEPPLVVREPSPEPLIPEFSRRVVRTHPLYGGGLNDRVEQALADDMAALMEWLFAGRW
jgi:curved DNA-binding protein CbpA